jgi:hypothetical protein
MKSNPDSLPSSLFSTHLERNHPVWRLMTTLLSLGCIFGVSVAAYLARPNPGLVPSGDVPSPLQDTAQSSSGLAAQSVFSVQGFRINAATYNRERQKVIARDSKKLLSLVVQVKSELDQTSDRGPSSEAIRKMGEIEKLARSVKEKMSISPGTN